MASPAHDGNVFPIALALVFPHNSDLRTRLGSFRNLTGGEVHNWQTLPENNSSGIHPLVLEVLRTGSVEDVNNQLEFVLLTTFKSYGEKELALTYLNILGIDLGKIHLESPFTVKILTSFPTEIVTEIITSPPDIITVPDSPPSPPPSWSGAFEHPTLWDCLGKNKYLQIAVSKAVARVYAVRFGAVTSKFLSRIAASDGDLSVLAWAREIGCDWSETVFLKAVEGGQASTLQFLVDNHCPIPSGTQAFEVASQARNLHTLEWLDENKFEYSSFASLAAARIGWVEGVEWLHAHGYPLSRLVSIFSANAGHLDVLKFARRKDCAGDPMEDAVDAAAAGGQIAALQFLREEGCAINRAVTCANAALHGRLETLKWLRANNARWDKRTVAWARKRGHLEVETWAIGNGCPQPLFV